MNPRPVIFISAVSRELRTARGLLIMLIGGGAWLLPRQYHGEEKIKHVVQQADELKQQNEKLLVALRELPGILSKQEQRFKPALPDWRSDAAYAVLEEQNRLPKGTLKKELPAFAAQLLARSDISALDRANALFATKKFAECEAAALLAHDEAHAAAGQPVRDTIAALVLAGDAAREQLHDDKALHHYRAAAALTDEKRDPLEWARVQWDVADVLDRVDMVGKTEPIYRRVIEVYQRELGAEHRDTLMSRNNLAAALSDHEKYVEAEAEHRAVLAIMERVLGAEHPDTLASRNNLANALSRHEKYVEAEAEYRAVLAIRERVLGAEHPDTVDSRISVAFALRDQGKHAEAEAELRAVLTIRERVLGPENYHVSMSCVNLAVCLEDQKKLSEALEFRRRAASGLAKVFGPEHGMATRARAEVERIEAKLKAKP